MKIKINNSPKSLWEFSSYIIPIINIAGKWSLLLSGKIKPKEKNSLNVKSTKIHSAVTEVDILIQEMILKNIIERYTNIVPMGEEDTFFNSKKNFRRNDCECYYMSVDPLDGTFAYTLGVKDYCIMVSLTDKANIILGIIHFPALQETLLGIYNDGLYKIRYNDCSKSNPYNINNTIFEKITYNYKKNFGYLSVHYRFLKQDFKFESQKIAKKYTYKSLLGDDEIDSFKPIKFGSNGSLILDFINGKSIGYIGPYISFHDLLPLAAIVVSSGCSVQFYDSYKKKWDMISTDNALKSYIDGEKRCRAILSKDDKIIFELNTILSG